MSTQLRANENEAARVAAALGAFEKPQTVAPGNRLFREGDDARGVYFIRDGEFDLVYASRMGDAKPLRSAGPGTVLGLSCVVSNRAHDCSATAKTPATVGFVERKELEKVLDTNPELWFTVLRVISSEISSCWDCMRNFGKC